MDEFNDLHIDGMPKGGKAQRACRQVYQPCIPPSQRKNRQIPDDQATYLGNQLECEFGGDRCFGIAANMDFLLVCTYEENGKKPGAGRLQEKIAKNQMRRKTCI